MSSSRRPPASFGSFVHRSRGITARTFLPALLSLSLPTGYASAQSVAIRYEISSYGDSYATFTFHGPTASTLTTNVNSAQTMIRISAVDGRFTPATANPPRPSQIASITQVRRGLLTDLIVLMKAPSELSATPGRETLKIVIRSKRAAGAPTPTGGATLPIRSPAHAIQDEKGRWIVRLPPLSGETSLSRTLRATAYLIDIVWLTLTRSRPTVFDPAAPAASFPPGSLDAPAPPL